ncbi:hypothetical protein TWF102_000436 [Orbilia oligospora]|uniref:Uncharacterized protein n=1 Tax=Orbilia oligospora TaxID=2813651 RepID=A0A7C8N5E6_ORBOL|nr:hypothetical protein TWF103_004227 [Orbilia oligospora]KAF3084194.1 hypothetical protein TWF102_000436 [Orbilia oligospora]KAF3121477.1 hypothetical protein TWF594_003192 [Orbilia oligospora]
MASSGVASANRQLSSKTFDSALEDALRNNTPLLSWKSALHQLDRSRSSVAVRNLKSWLLSSPQLSSLTSSYAAIPSPNAASQQAFETKTSMINITADTLIPIADIKEDALYLSKSIDLDELEALRICILEYQERSPALASVSNDTTDNQQALLSMSMFTKSTNRLNAASDIQTPETQRRDRQRNLYFSERRFKIKVATSLVRNVVDYDAKAPRKTPFYGTAKKILRKMIGEGKKDGKGGFVEELIADISNSISTAKVPRAFSEDRPQSKFVENRGHWERQVLVNIYHCLKFLFLLIYGPISPSGTIVSAWFQCMGSTAFLTDLKFLSKPLNSTLQDFLNAIIPLGAIVSFAMLSVDSLEARLTGNFTSLAKEIEPSASLYLEEAEAVGLVHEVLLEYVGERCYLPASLAGWAWAIILRTYSDIQEDEFEFSNKDLKQPGTPLQRIHKIMANIMASSTQAEGPALYLAKKALKANILQTVENLVHGLPGGGGWSLQMEEDGEKMRQILAGLMRMGMDLLDWDLGAIEAFVATHKTLSPLRIRNKFQKLGGEDGEEEENPDEEDDPSANRDITKGSEAALSRGVWTDRTVIERTIHIARARFPYEPIPFCAILGATTPREIVDEPYNLGFKYLEDHMESFTYALPPNFRGTEVDENDAGKIVLLEDLMVVEGRREDGGGAFILPAGIFGRIISSGVSPPVVRWDYRYSGVEFLGRLLERTLLDGTLHEPSLAIEILGIFDNILVSYRDKPDNLGDFEDRFNATNFLEGASNILAPNSDIISVILDLFEASLPLSVMLKSVELSSACLRVIITLISIVPGRIWPLLGRSSLLERNGRGGLLGKILESVEIVQGKYTFLLTTFSMYEALLSDAIAGVVFSGTIGSPGSIVSGAGVGSGISKEMQASILQDWTRFWCSIFESFTTWKYLHVDERLMLNFKLCTTFSRVLKTVYGVASDENQGYGLFEGLAPSASTICSTFFNPAITQAVDPLLLAINEGLETKDSTINNLFILDWIDSVVASLEFSSTALKVQHLQKKTPSYLEGKLYERSLDLIALYEVDETFRRPVIEVLDSLLDGSGLWVGEPPSILGHIGSSGANHLLELIQRLGGRLGDEELEVSIWKFFCTVIANKQQGLSIKLVTGNNLEVPNPTRGTPASLPKRAKSMLASALETLVNIESLPGSLLISTLQAVSIAQDFWGPIISNLPDYPEFLKAITSYIEKVVVNYSAKTPPAITESCNKTAAAAYIAQILTMHLYQIRSTKSSDPKTKEFLVSLLPKLKFYIDHGAVIRGYKASMHGLLSLNLQNKWPNCHLENFRKSSMQERRYGTNYFYDIELAEHILRWDRGWNSIITRRASNKVIEIRTGFKLDVEAVNLNLALIDSQVFLFDMWANLALELTCHKFFQSPDGFNTLSRVGLDTLKATIGESTPPTISPILNTKRTSLAFSLFRRLGAINLNQNQSQGSFSKILETTWDVAAAAESNFLSGLSNGGSENSRNLLRLLYLALNMCLNSKEDPSPRVVYLLVGIFEVAVARAFKVLANAAYENSSPSIAGDMLVVIGILQTILSFDGLEPVYEHLVSHIANHGTIRVATILFTWASKLVDTPADVNSTPDPLYGEISIMFLVKVSALPVFAEQIALNSVFNSLSEGDLAMKIQAGQLLPTTTPRLHNIWAKGFLPLLLNVLFALKKRVAPEIAMFLRSFNRQILSTITYLSKPEYVALSHLEEVTDLVAILVLLDRMGSSPGDELMNRVRSLDTACEQIVSHKAWLAKVLVATNVEEDSLLQDIKDGSNKLSTKVGMQARLIQRLIVLVDGEEE